MKKLYLVIISIIVILTILASIFVLALQNSPSEALFSGIVTNPTSVPTPTPTPSPTLVPKATMTLKITDTRTGRNVDDVEVLVDGMVIGTTVQSGELDVPNLEYGRHRVSILVPYYEQCKVEQYVDLSGNTFVPVSIDMPNPVFQVSANFKANTELFNEYGSGTIEITNTGELVSQDTIAIIFVYTEDNSTTPIGTHIVDFGNIAAGAQLIKREIGRMDEFVWGKTEEIAVVVVDRWQYTPQNNQVVTQSQVPQSFSTQIVNYAYSYIQQHPDALGTIAKIVLVSV